MTNPKTERSLMSVLATLIQTRGNGDGWAALDVHGRTLKALRDRGWIEARGVHGETHYHITDAGVNAYIEHGEVALDGATSSDAPVQDVVIVDASPADCEPSAHACTPGCVYRRAFEIMVGDVPEGRMLLYALQALKKRAGTP